MRVQRLDIENFRGIREMRIDFHPRLNVFVGKNGAGKTTIFNALGKAIQVAHLNHVAGDERQDLENRTIVHFHDIRIGAEQSRISLQFSLRGKPIRTTTSSRPKEMASDLDSHFPGAGIRIPHQAFLEDRSTLTGTHMPDERTRNLISGADPLMGHAVSNITRFAWAFTWISDREAVESSRLKKFIYGGKEFGKDPFEKDNILQAVKAVIAEITGFDELFDDREKQGFTVRKCLRYGEDVLLFSQLSSGEQHLVAFVATIASFLADSFPDAENPLHGEAVFMVDAIELHLHPSWQREIIPRLLAAFPNCQFVITTHSPQVLGNVKPESVFILEETDGEVTYQKPDESYGMTMDRILELVMADESRPAEPVREQLEALFEHISRKEFDNAYDIVKSLKSEIPTDPDLIRAEMILHRKGMGL
ncbi:AAA family ATPase [Desulfobacterales bacterium HSG2]|nr:AAA family ATPase [Desulfobacterales bacterium HSG2]